MAKLVTLENNGTQSTIDSSTLGGGSSLQFDHYVIKFSTPPTLNSTITNGKVFNYTLDAVTRFRFVPTIYNPTQDAFYSTFTSGVLSGLITKRG